ncbi:MAG: EamA family transporter [Pseudomonadota bacterium]
MTFSMTTFGLVSCILILNVTANILIKIGVAKTPQLSMDLFNQLNISVLGGLACFAISFIAYSLLLKKVPLYVAQCFVSGQFVAVILASYFLLGESITWQKAAGIVLIALGIMVVGSPEVSKAVLR